MFALLMLSQVVAGPADIKVAVIKLRDGDYLTLEKGIYPSFTIRNIVAKKGVIVNARKATLKEIRVYDSKGITLLGGKITGNRTDYFGILIARSSYVTVSGFQIGGVKTGILVGPRSQFVTIANNRLDGVASDGINVSGSQNIKIVGNYCANFRPILASYDERGKMVRDGDHPDCIQTWSLKGQEPNANIEISRNTISGAMQAITSFDPGNGGVFNYVVRDNIIEVSNWHGITLMDSVGAVVTGNTISTPVGAMTTSPPYQKVLARLTVSGTGMTVCNNSVNNRLDKRC